MLLPIVTIERVVWQKLARLGWMAQHRREHEFGVRVLPFGAPRVAREEPEEQLLSRRREEVILHKLPSEFRELYAVGNRV